MARSPRRIKRAIASGQPAGARGPRSWSAPTATASHLRSRLVYERVADSDPLREPLAQRGVELVCPNRKGRVRKGTHDGRKLRRHRKRWKIERAIAWLHDFRRVITRYEIYAPLYHGFVKLACLISLRRLRNCL